MKRTRFLINLNASWLILLLCITAQTAHSQETKPFSLNESPLPAPTGFVNDYVGVIDATTKQKLEAQLKSLKETTNPPIEIAVAIVRTTGERPIFDYTLAVARGWKIGAKELDNPSALLLIAIDDRKYFTQVSKDLEDELPDGLVGQLQRQNLVPAFRQGDYAKGISDTIDAYLKTIAERSSGQTVAPPETDNGRSDRRGGSSLGSCSPCLIIIIILLIFIFSRGGRGGGGGGGGGRNRWRGGGFGGSALPWIVGGMLGGMGNSGGGSSSGWGGGSSSDGGGFGGFGGGGDFGGGGGGGDW
ncbi:MAG TPA: TPM domain-containing protein [Pyrinomonadaceae bacterium]|nr:TPM domain-containing protein [Pyrinomonadaceae bacterium]